MIVIGLMSGTSLDGIDVAAVDLEGQPPNLACRLLAWDTYPYPARFRRRLLRVATPGGGTTQEVCQLNFELGDRFGQSVLRFLREKALDPAEVKLVGSHGQTVCHLPPAPGRRGATLQIGEPSLIAERTGLPTIADFRPRDMAAGGQGAPLVPYVDYLLFHVPGRTRVVQNIGGIANLAVVSEAAGSANLLAFDTGPGNMVIDALAHRLSGGKLTCDLDGRWAAEGEVCQELLAELLSEGYFSAPPPKSTGREAYGSAYVAALLEYGRRCELSAQSLVATATMLTVESIARAYERWVIPRFGLDEVILGGGGAKNPTLVRWLKERLPGVALTDHARYGLPNQAKEAFAFAVLAYLARQGEPNNLPAATGASHPVVMGKFIPGRN